MSAGLGRDHQAGSASTRSSAPSCSGRRCPRPPTWGASCASGWRRHRRPCSALFFAFTGLRTQVGLIAGPAQWLDAGLIVLTAIAGKLGGSALAARATGLDWREATALGVLMNTRGLMELVILSIGLDLGVISPTLFTMMVLMALVTTFMTSPLLAWIYPQEPVAPRAPAPRADASTVLIAVAAAASGPPLLQAALALVPAARMRVIALHLREAGERSISGDARRPLDDDALQAPLLATAAAHDAAQPLSFFSRDLGRDIAAARDGAADLVLVGWRQPPTRRRAAPGATLTSLLEETAAVVAIHVARAPRPWRRVAARCDGGPDDRAACWRWRDAWR
ncbi:MAG: cation:proton antiporter [Candidatus Binatia bacterium]